MEQQPTVFSLNKQSDSRAKVDSYYCKEQLKPRKCSNTNLMVRWEKTPASHCSQHSTCSENSAPSKTQNFQVNFYLNELLKNKTTQQYITPIWNLQHKPCFSVVMVLCCSEPYLSASACVMSMRGSETMGRLVGLVRVTRSSSGVSDLTLSLSFSICRHDNGGSCRLPENLLWTLHNSTPRVLPVETCPTEASLFS